MKTMLFTLGLTIAAPASAFAFGGIGCTDLPEHDRAIGALEGMTGACDMSVEQARRILAGDGGQGIAPQGVALQPTGPDGAPLPRPHRRHHRHHAPRP